LTDRGNPPNSRLFFHRPTGPLRKIHRSLLIPATAYRINRAALLDSFGRFSSAELKAVAA
jgi:hypothetical protein